MKVKSIVAGVFALFFLNTSCKDDFVVVYSTDGIKTSDGKQIIQDNYTELNVSQAERRSYDNSNYFFEGKVELINTCGGGKSISYYYELIVPKSFVDHPKDRPGKICDLR